jgi:hypothetical protein
MRPDAQIPPATSNKPYLVISRSKLTSRLPSPATARKPSSGGFVFLELHAIAVPSLLITSKPVASTPRGRCLPLTT